MRRERIGRNPSSQIRRPRWASRLDRVVVTLFFIAWGLALLRFAPAFVFFEQGIPACLGVVAGYLLADLLSGSVHWLADRFFTPTTPLLGPLLIAPFRDHHVDEAEMARHDFFEISGNNALVTLPVVLLLFSLPVPDKQTSLLLAGGIGLGLGLTASLFLTNQFHGWAHQPSPPAAIRCLQRWGWILSPERHALHHRDPHDRAYCVTSGWLNPLLDRIRFFPALESLIATIGRQRRRTI